MRKSNLRRTSCSPRRRLHRLRTNEALLAQPSKSQEVQRGVARRPRSGHPRPRAAGHRRRVPLDLRLRAAGHHRRVPLDLRLHRRNSTRWYAARHALPFRLLSAPRARNSTQSRDWIWQPTANAMSRKRKCHACKIRHGTERATRLRPIRQASGTSTLRAWSSCQTTERMRALFYDNL